jgi:serine/threonine protein kinase
MGDWFGSYELHEKLGEGGMAEVFRASRRGADGFVRTVCIKRLLRHIEADEQMAASFGDEARIMAALHHPAIVSVLEYGRHEGRSYLAMELVEGTDLRRVLRRTGPLPHELAIYVAHEIATALAHAHAVQVDGVAQRVVHRDVTPSNVLLSVDGTVKLTDFGIAKATTRAQVTQHGIVKGKVPYMSPEQAVGLELDQRADLFALGVVLYECIAGRRPYDGPSDLDTFRNVQSGVHESLDRLAPSTPRALVDLVQALLRPRREDRIPSAAEVVELLGQFPITLGTRRALRDRVARSAKPRAAAPAPSSRPSSQPSNAPAFTPAPIVAPAATRAVKARPLAILPAPKQRLTVTEAMSPTAIARSLAESEASCFAPPASASRFSQPPIASPEGTREPTEKIRHAPPSPSIRLSRNAMIAVAIAWIALSSILGGLAAQLLPSVHVSPATPTAMRVP